MLLTAGPCLPICMEPPGEHPRDAMRGLRERQARTPSGAAVRVARLPTALRAGSRATRTAAPVPSLGRQQAVEEEAVPRERDAEVLGADVVAAVPLALEPLALVREP